MIESNSGHRSRLRSRYRASGLASLHDYEIIELLLTYAQPRRDCKQLAKRLIAEHKSVAGVLDTPAAELAKTAGLGEVGATLISLVRDLEELYIRSTIQERDLFAADSVDGVICYLRSSLRHQRNEVVKVLYLDGQNQLICDENVQEGTVNRSAIFPRRIIESALGHRAVALILAHNHPGGNPSPSPEDLQLTKHIATAAKLFDIRVLDHVIIAGSKVYSFAQADLL